MGGPDPEELEEECKMLEGLISKQEKDMEAFKKQRERNARLEQEVEDSKDDDAKSDASEEEQKPKVMKSELGDGRMEAAASSFASAGMSALGRVKTKLQVQSVLGRLKGAVGENQAAAAEAQAAAALSPAKDTAPASPPSASTVTAVQSNRQVQMLQDKISEKEFKIAKAKEVHARMKKEFALLKYCAKKSDAGLE